MQRNKRFLFLSTRDSEGGATTWFFNLANILYRLGYEVAFVVTEKRKKESFIIQVPVIKERKSYVQRFGNLVKRNVGVKDNNLETIPEYAFFPGEEESISYISAEHIIEKLPFTPDIIISGLTFGFVNTSTLLNLKKHTSASVYQTSFDMSVFTGGCHVLSGCEGFLVGCTGCPGILNNKGYSSTNFDIKKKNIIAGDFGVLLGPGWTLFQANQSALYKNLRKVVVGPCIDTTFFTNMNRDIAKRIFALPLNSKVIFVGSDNVKDKRKGLIYFIEALDILWDTLTPDERESTVVVLAGKDIDENELASKIKFQKKLISYISDYRLLSLLYQASDIFVCTSIEDAGPMMVAEAMSCGTPVVGFKMGLLYDDSIIRNGVNGYRVSLKDSFGLSEGIRSILNLEKLEYTNMSNSARSTVIELLSEEYFINSISKL